MNILSFDAVTPHASVAVLKEDEPVYERTWKAGRNHAVELPAAIASAMDYAGVEWKALDGVVIGTGPGSYTGIRIAISIAEGIAAGARCRIFGVSSLEHLAYGCAAWRGPITAAVPLGQDRFGLATFMGPWETWSRVSKDEAFTQTNLPVLSKDALKCGRAKGLISGGVCAPDESDVQRAAVLGALIWRTGRLKTAEEQPVTPNYLRLSSAEERLETA